MSDTDSTSASSASLTSQGNVVIGKDAMSGAIVDQCNRNIAIGERALAGVLNNSGSNVAIGYESLDSLAAGNSNTCVGYKSGDALVSGTYNVCVGYDVGVGSTAQVGAMAFGRSFSAADQDNEVTFGNGTNTMK